MVLADIGIYGLGVMGFNLGRNIQRNGFKVAVYNRTPERVQAFVEQESAGPRPAGARTLEELVSLLARPRKLLLMIPAGDPVDHAIRDLRPLLEPGDILIDGGNSYFLDTERRSEDLSESGIEFVGLGVSGGEEGALWGPSLMPGGSPQAYQELLPILEKIAARAEDGQPCVSYIGPRGAGHYVKMVHNGIEYADMQLIAEAYDLLHRGAGFSTADLQQEFERWNQGVLKSYLIEITARVLKKIDSESGNPLVEMILDEAEQKGTGKWTSQNALDIGAPVPTISAAVHARILSGQKDERMQASRELHGPDKMRVDDENGFLSAVADALYASKVLSYAQGMTMLRVASQEYDYHLNLAEIARIWRAGCIIRADLLNDIMRAFQKQPDLTNLLLAPVFKGVLHSHQAALREVVQTAVRLGIPVLGMSSALGYYDSYRSQRLPANLIQALRDYFGAHTYRRLDREGTFHTEWDE